MKKTFIQFEIKGSFKNDVDNCYEFIDKYNNMKHTQFMIPIKTKENFSIISKFTQNKSNIENIKI